MSTAKRRINSTGRKRIAREDIDIRMLPNSADQPAFVTLQLEHADWKFPASADVILEAYQRSNGMRFDCGTVGSPKIPAAIRLDELDPKSPILFRLKVVDGETKTGKLLGSAERLRPDSSDNDEEGRRSLFPIVTRNIGHELWKVEITDAGPELVLNLKVPGFKQTMMDNPLLLGAVLPLAFRHVLKALCSDPTTHDDDDGSWEADWISFCLDELGLEDPSELESEAREAWVEEGVTKFCSEHEFASRARSWIEGGKS